MALSEAPMNDDRFVQTLESRRLFTITVSGGLLTVTGGTGVDIVQADVSGSFIIVTQGKTTKKVAANTVTRISVNLLGGNDFCSLGRLTQNATILGGDGNDTITGGEGNDSIDGQNGNDLIQGRGGN